MLFADYVKGLLKERGLTLREVSERLGLESHGYVQCVLAGKRPPPLKNITQWIKAVRMTAKEAALAREYAEMDLTPPSVRDRIKRLESKVAAK